MSDSASAGDGTAVPSFMLESALARARQGELAAFGELIRAHQDTVYSLALRMLKVPEDAEELAQDVFISAHRHLGKIASAAHLLFWLRRTVCHRAIDRLRRRQHPAVPLES
ncbi:MAG: RNA polymerase sigma factor, partial [Steroidobacteraceae bacterium]